MKNNFNQQRRNFLKRSLVLGALITSDWSVPSFVYSNCNLTARESSGPFYPLSYPLDQDNDLTYLKDKSQKAKGEIIYIKGVVQGENCEPVSKATIEIWQACATGRYNHPEDRNPAELDPNFSILGKRSLMKRENMRLKLLSRVLILQAGFGRVLLIYTLQFVLQSIPS